MPDDKAAKCVPMLCAVRLKKVYAIIDRSEIEIIINIFVSPVFGGRTYDTVRCLNKLLLRMHNGRQKLLVY